ncbi:MAG: HNH endonuclease signature motif containing protein [Elusimicrobiota bacterium]
MQIPVDCDTLSDRDLIFRLKQATTQERRSLIMLLCYLAEADRRQLHAKESSPSLFAYCVAELHYCEGAAYRRIHAARAASKFPAIYSLLADGALSLGTISMLAPHLTKENSGNLLARAQGKSKRELQFLLASLSPGTERPDFARCLPAQPAQTTSPSPSTPLRMLPAPESAPDPIAGPEGSTSLVSFRASPVPQSHRQSVQPYARHRARIAFDCDEGLLRKLERAREVLRHKFPAGRYEEIFTEALEALLDKKDPEHRLQRNKGHGRRANREQRGRVDGSRTLPRTRRIPQAVRDEVWRRDGGRCAFTGPDGSRCPERGGLEFDHMIPWALGGRSDTPRNIRLLCRTHNRLLARQAFGDAAMRPARHAKR